MNSNYYLKYFLLLDVKPTPPRISSKRIKREIYRSNTCPVLATNPPLEKNETQSGQRKSKRLRKSNISPPPTPTSRSVSPEHSPPIKKEPINTMKRLLPSSSNKDPTNPNQVIVKTDKRHYWCTKCSKVYLNLISLYTESHYRQCVSDDQHFNVINDPSFFTNEDILQQLPSNLNNENSILTTTDSNESITNNSRKKESIFFSKTTDDSRTYFINGKPIRMSTINRSITVKDLRQQFQQQSSFTINNPSEEYIFQQRQTTTSSRSNESLVKVIPTPRSFDTFGISSDEEEEEADNNEEEKSDKSIHIKQEKPEIEKTLVKRRYDSEYASTNNTITSIGQDDTHKQSKSFLSKKNSSSKRSLSQTQSSSSSSPQHSWKQKDEPTEWLIKFFVLFFFYKKYSF